MIVPAQFKVTKRGYYDVSVLFVRLSINCGRRQRLSNVGQNEDGLDGLLNMR